MKENSIGKKMRTIAGIVYGLYTLVLMFSMRFFLIVDSEKGVSVAVTQLTSPWIMFLGLIIGGSAMCIWLLSSNEYLSAKTRSAIVTGTVLLVAFYMISYTALSEAVRLMLAVTFGMEYSSSIWEIILFAVQLVLIILAAFFVTCAHEMKIEETEEVTESEEVSENTDAETLEIEEIIIETTETLEEETEDNNSESDKA